MYRCFMTSHLRSNAWGQGKKIEIALENEKNKQADNSDINLLSADDSPFVLILTMSENILLLWR